MVRWCGNDPRAQLTAEDRAAIADFRRYLELTHRRDAGGELTDDEQTFVTDYEKPPAPPAA